FVGCSQWRLKTKGSDFFYYLNEEIDPLLLKRLFEKEAKTYGIPKTGKNRGLVAREKQSIKRAETTKVDLDEEERLLDIEERKLKLEREKLELMKLCREISLSGLDDDKI
ncbi:5934_t:CDS:2, partial [Dentiscutata erythropus]